MMSSLVDSIKKLCSYHGVEHNYFLAFSGGLDSTVLLHLLANIRSLYPIKLHAVHIHHGLSPYAFEWAEHCKKICDEFSINFTLHQITINRVAGESLEEVARQYRYKIFQSLINKNDILLTAHHQDDQAETVLLQLCRGAGPKGLAAMPRLINFHKGFLARPLLEFSREDLKKYAEHHQLCWIEDESNQNKNFTRNFIRHEILSTLKQRWPTIEKTLSRVADHCAEMQMLVEEFSRQDLINCVGSKSETLSVKKILQLPSARQRQVIRLWLDQFNFPIPSMRKMQHILQDVLHAREDKSPCVTWGNVELRRYRDDLYIMNTVDKIKLDKSLLWDLQQPLVLSKTQMLKTIPVLGKGLRKNITSVCVRFRQGGEHFYLPDRKHRHALKKLFQEWGILPWQRDQIPLLFVDDELAVIVGYAIADKFKAMENEEGVEITF